MSPIKTTGVEMIHCILYICDYKVKLSKYSWTVSTF